MRKLSAPIPRSRRRTAGPALWLRFGFALAGGLLLGGLVAGAADITPLSLAGGANTAMADDTADDRKGGWTDQGANDLRVMKPGSRDFGGIPFLVLDDRATNDRSCVVVAAAAERAYLPKRATVALTGPARGKALYLLHAAAWENDKSNLVGRLTVEYADKSSKEFRVRNNRDILDWWANRSASNAARVWTAYNGNSQVSLYASRFPLDDKDVASVRFDAGDASVWMVVGAAIGESVAPKGIVDAWRLDKDYPAPERPDARRLASLPRDGAPKNIVLVIGDGMGQAAVRYAGAYAHGAPQTLAMDQFPVRGLAVTRSANAGVTDSAASGTALSSGYKTNNGMLGMNPQKEALRSLAEEARDSGRAVGVITTDALVGATPAAFFAHVPSRGMREEIAEYALESGFDLLVGSGDTSFFRPAADRGKRKDERNLLKEFAAKGHAGADTLDAFRAAEKLPAVGFVPGWSKQTELLSLYATEALRRLAENPRGFFLMVEGSYPDYGGHGNNPDLSVNGVLMVDFTAKAAVDFAAERGDTLVVVTADHETGGLYWAPNPANARRPHVGYMTKGHTGVPVDVFAFGPGADRFAGPIDNTDIPTAMAGRWKLPLGVPVAPKP